MPLSTAELILIVLAFALALLLTPAVRGLARRWGAVAQPKADRWHKQPTALLGGIAIYMSVIIVYCLAPPANRSMLTILAASSWLWLVGLLDDLRPLKPYQKLIGQLIAASVITYSGLTLPWTPSPILNMGITLFWLVGITNAINLLDNMDGLAAGISAIAAVFLGICFATSGQHAEAWMLFAFAAALAGFLVYNSNPASIFMGDCGSMFLGFFLASMALLSASGGRSRTLLPVLAVPVLVLLIPIFDITIVTLLRKLAGRRVSQGGRDHTSHRLVALGLSERRAVWMLYSLATASGVLALLVRDATLEFSIVAVMAFTVGLTLLGVYLGRVRVYSEEEIAAARTKPLVAFLFELSHRRRVFEVLLDVVLIILSYGLAYQILHGPIETPAAWQTILLAVPVLVSVKLATFLVFGVYRGMWQYVSVENVVMYAKAAGAASVLSAVALVMLFRFEGISRAVLVLDGMLMLLLLCGSRIAFRLFRGLIPNSHSASAPRVMIYGAGDAGEMLLRILRNNQELVYRPVGFLDDDPLKAGKVIHGLRVYGGNGSMTRICQQHQVQEILIAGSKFSDDRTREILNECQRSNVAVKRMRVQIEQLSAADA